MWPSWMRGRIVRRRRRLGIGSAVKQAGEKMKGGGLYRMVFDLRYNVNDQILLTNKQISVFFDCQRRAGRT